MPKPTKQQQNTCGQSFCTYISFDNCVLKIYSSLETPLCYSGNYLQPTYNPNLLCFPPLTNIANYKNQHKTIIYKNFKNYKRIYYNPMQTQNTIPLQQPSINPTKITTSYGCLHSITCGTYGKPLIMVVHGSGSDNSSNKYKKLLIKYHEVVNKIKEFYFVAIDCPGYGLSQGSKSVIKNNAVNLFKQILIDLKYEKYYALIGVSQGGGAILNAITVNPFITNFMILDRPVYGDLKRFLGFNLPTLLIYDRQSLSPTINQGKQLYKYLNNCQLHVYRQSLYPNWTIDRLWQVMLPFFDKPLNESFKKQFQHKEIRKIELNPQEQQPTKLIQIDERRKQQIMENKCSICYDIPYKPVILNCKHTFCSACFLEIKQLNNKCALCRARIQKKQDNKQLQSQIEQILPSKQLQFRQKCLKKLMADISGAPFYVIIGNYSQEYQASKSSNTKKRYNWQVYVKDYKQFPLEQVIFMINPYQILGHTVRKTIKLTQPPYYFADRSTDSFWTRITIRPKNISYQQKSINYYINLTPGHHTQSIKFRKPRRNSQY